jgi:hypothetical protein
LSTATYVRSVVTACMTRQGTPTFVLTSVAVTEEELRNGIQYDLADSQLLIDGYEEPFVHFDQDEAPPFLLPGVRDLQASASPQPALSEAS